MFRRDFRYRTREVIEVFLEKDVTNPGKALTIQELGLWHGSENALRWLIKLGVVVEINGRYYLDKERLRQVVNEFKERHGVAKYRYNVLRILLMLPLGLIIAMVTYIILIFIGIKPFPGLFLIVLVITSILVNIIRIYYIRSRIKFRL
ncbi:MAG: hypothetical protein QXX61_02700 [Ignisphaera sp.]